ncbi:MAG: lipoyl(octanoyl) transferase LipB [Gammaproteobacteria bacterium]
MQLTVRQLGLCDYLSTWDAMCRFTTDRGRTTADEIWLLQHPPVYTLGLSGRTEHLLRATDIPVVHCDRGGQVTFHGPGQLIAYALLDLHRLGLGVSAIVNRLERAIIDSLGEYSIAATRTPQAPGVYIEEMKIASIGLRVRRGCTYHGLALNVDMDLQPFADINPCGYPDLKVTQLSNLGVREDLSHISQALIRQLQRQLGYNSVNRAPPVDEAAEYVNVYQRFQTSA